MEDTRIRTHYGAAGPLISVDTGSSWSSRRDRIGPGVGSVVSIGGVHMLSGSTFLGGLSVDDPTGSIELHGGAVVGGALDVLTGSLVLGGVVVDTTPTSTATPVQDGVNALYTLPDLDVTCPTGLDCAPLEPEPYVSWSPTLPLERWMPFPNHSHLACALAQPDPNLSFDGVCWGLDPNADGLPVAWLVAHGADPSCWDAGPALFDPVADVDGDGLVNAVEASLGTWPCIADTDGDFLPDGDDPDPLAP
ncbi:MAG: hypothetical protein KC656_32670, partial [Myxococcales bacterium]|nr:hypothetical protein [Myxococcales bacterium]